jgi:hypothetical protein
MTALPPDLAAAYVRELTCDTRAVAVRGPGGALLAGEDPPAGAEVVRSRQGQYEIAVATGPRALAALARHDAEAALAALLSAGNDR